MSLLHFSKGQNVAFGSAQMFVILNFLGEIYDRYSTWKELLLSTFLLRGTVLEQYHNIKKYSKESNKKCLEITEGSLLFHCQNRQNAKVSRCHFYYLKIDCHCHNILSSFSFDCWCFLRGLSPVSSTPW